MAVQTVKVMIGGQEHSLTYDGDSRKWTASLVAPDKSSYNEDGHYYDVTVKATDDAGNIGEASASTEGEIGEALRLVVKEHNKPTITITAPGADALITNNTPVIKAQIRDDDSGIDITSLSLKIDSGATVGNTSPGMSVQEAENGYDITSVSYTHLDVYKRQR